MIAPGYQTAKKSFEVLEHGEVIVKIELQPMTDKEAAASDKGIAALKSEGAEGRGQGAGSSAGEPAGGGAEPPGSGTTRRTE